MTFTKIIQSIGIDEATFETASEEQRVAWAKANTTAGFGLCEGAMNWLKKHKDKCGYMTSDAAFFKHYCDFESITLIYRLSPDYQTPVKRWVFHPGSLAVDWTRDATIKHGWLEVTADYAAYLSDKPDGEWELRKVKKGDVTLNFFHLWREAERDYQDGGPHDRGYRWCKPRPTMGWVEYDVTVDEIGKWKSYTVEIEGVELDLTQASCLVGFGGVQFEEPRNNDIWFMMTAGYLDINGRFGGAATSKAGLLPATPIRARFWQEVK